MALLVKPVAQILGQHCRRVVGCEFILLQAVFESFKVLIPLLIIRSESLATGMLIVGCRRRGGGFRVEKDSVLWKLLSREEAKATS